MQIEQTLSSTYYLTSYGSFSVVDELYVNDQKFSRSQKLPECFSCQKVIKDMSNNSFKFRMQVYKYKYTELNSAICAYSTFQIFKELQ